MMNTVSSTTKKAEYRITVEGNPYPRTISIVNQMTALEIKKRGFEGPLGQLFSLEYSVYKESKHLFTVVDGGFSNMPRIALKVATGSSPFSTTA